MSKAIQPVKIVLLLVSPVALILLWVAMSNSGSSTLSSKEHDHYNDLKKMVVEDGVDLKDWALRRSSRDLSIDERERRRQVEILEKSFPSLTIKQHANCLLKLHADGSIDWAFLCHLLCVRLDYETRGVKNHDTVRTALEDIEALGLIEKLLAAEANSPEGLYESMYLLTTLFEFEKFSNSQFKSFDRYMSVANADESSTEFPAGSSEVYKQGLTLSLAQRFAHSKLLSALSKHLADKSGQNFTDLGIRIYLSETLLYSKDWKAILNAFSDHVTPRVLLIDLLETQAQFKFLRAIQTHGGKVDPEYEKRVKSLATLAVDNYFKILKHKSDWNKRKIKTRYGTNFYDSQVELILWTDYGRSTALKFVDADFLGLETKEKSAFSLAFVSACWNEHRNRLKNSNDPITKAFFPCLRAMTKGLTQDDYPIVVYELQKSARTNDISQNFSKRINDCLGNN